MDNHLEEYIRDVLGACSIGDSSIARSSWEDRGWNIIYNRCERPRRVPPYCVLVGLFGLHIIEF